ncbi:MAG: bifunctional nuclease domain-containing protein [Phycisphaerae bacterium]
MNVPMELSRILISETGDQQIIFLKEKAGPRTFPIMIGIAEAIAIERRLKHIPTPRPMTHDLLASIIEHLGGTVEKIVISDLRDHTFIATLFIRRDGELMEVDSRPSDAIALGSAFDTPIYVAEHVLSEVVGEPTTRAERIDMLRQRLAMLSQRMGEYEDRLSDQEFLSQAPEELIAEHRRQVQEMQTEYDAIQEVLDKFGG